MAIALEFCNLLIPLENLCRCTGPKARAILDRVQPGGGFLNYVEWHDDHLYRDGTMGGDDDEARWIREWQAEGLQPVEERDGRKAWKDICVFNSGFGPTLPCDWLEYDRWNNCVSLRGEPRGLLVGRRGVMETCDETWDEVVAAFKRGRHRAGIGALRALADIGYAKAEFELAELLRVGEWAGRRVLSEPDPVEAATWYRRAAEHGWAPAQQVIRTLPSEPHPEAVPPATEDVPAATPVSPIELARVFVEMGDREGARDVLVEARSRTGTAEALASEDEIEEALRALGPPPSRQ